MTLDDLERQNRFFLDFLHFLARDTFQKRIAPKSFEIDMNKLHMKFSALNIDFGSASLDFLGSRKLGHEGIKEQYCHKSCYFSAVGQSCENGCK